MVGMIHKGFLGSSEFLNVDLVFTSMKISAVEEAGTGRADSEEPAKIQVDFLPYNRVI